MAYETDTVLGASALLAALETFLVANGWTVVRSGSIAGSVDFTNNNLVVSNTGFGGNDIIYAGFELDTDDLYSGTATFANLGLQSFTAFDASLDNDDQEGANATRPILVSEVSASIDYHFICNDRRIIVITSHSSGTIWEIAYIGYIIPYGNKEEFANPVFVGGTTMYANTLISDFTNKHRSFFDPTAYKPNPSNDALHVAYLKVGSNWTAFANRIYTVGDLTISYSNLRTMMPYASNNTNTPIWRSLGINEDGYYCLFPITFIDKYDANTVYGELDGIYAVISSALSAGDIITYDGDNYIIVQNTYGTLTDNLCAVRLT